MGSYKDLRVWQRAMELVTEIYRLTKQLPESERYGLINQMQRAAVAVPSNIAEGQKRRYIKEFLQFLYISYGSGAELETQLEICKRLYNEKRIDYSKADEVLQDVMKMLNALIRALKQKAL